MSDKKHKDHKIFDEDLLDQSDFSSDFDMPLSANEGLKPIHAEITEEEASVKEKKSFKLPTKLQKTGKLAALFGSISVTLSVILNHIKQSRQPNKTKVESAKEYVKKRKDQEKFYSSPKRGIFGFFAHIVAVLVSHSIVFAFVFVCVGGAVYSKERARLLMNLDPAQILSTVQFTSSTHVYADNRHLTEFAQQKRFYLPLERIPKQLQNAFIATEDSRFYHHFGVDLKGILVTILEKLVTGRERGASTITQQMVKNEVLKSSVTTIERKLTEILASIEIEREISKDRILELYLNGIFLGPNETHGVVAAAQYYFGKDLNELTLSQDAYIAGLPKAPSKYNLWRYPEEAKNRRDTVLFRMYDDGFISKEQLDQARSEPLIPARIVRDEAVQYAGHFASAVKKDLDRIIEEHHLVNDGLTVYTTLNAEYQQYAYEALRKGLMQYDRGRGWRGATQNISLIGEGERQIDWLSALNQIKLKGLGDWKKAIVLAINKTEVTIGLSNGAYGVIDREGVQWTRSNNFSRLLKIGDVIAVTNLGGSRYELQQIPEVSGAIIVINPNTGDILAMQGGFFYDANKDAINRIEAKRQPGSAFKPFVYLAAMENGYTPATNLTDEPTSFGTYNPKNFDKKYLGQMTIRKALCLSRNIPAVKTGQVVGMSKVASVTERLGLYSDPGDLREISTQLSSALGAKEVSPLALAIAYAQIVNGGKKIYPRLIDRIQDVHGKIVYRQDTRVCANCQQDEYDGSDMPYIRDIREEVLDPIAAYQVTSILECVTTSGTAPSVGRALERPIAGKTGTTNDEKDAWFVGFSPDLVAAVYIGYDQPRSLNRTGGRLAAPVFTDFMQKALKNEPTIPFRLPEGAAMMYVDNWGYPTYTTEGHLTAFIPGTEPINGPNFLSRPYDDYLYGDNDSFYEENSGNQFAPNRPSQANNLGQKNRKKGFLFW